MIEVYPIPAFQDNYLWLFHQRDSNRAYVVDPGDAAPVEATLKARDLQLAGILITHHHYDHIGGIEQLLNHHRVPVYGPHSNNIPAITHPLREGERIELDAGMCFRILEIPGHTLDHIAYFSQAGDQSLLFCGDTLFAGGCGRLFEGTAAQMHRSLAKLAALPADTAIYCAHEYTLANLAFAQAVESDNAALNERIARDTATRKRGDPTVPSTLGLELATNPFLRCSHESVKSAAEEQAGGPLASPEEVLAAVRQWKDNF